MLHVVITDEHGCNVDVGEEFSDTYLFIRELKRETKKIMAKLSEQVTQLTAINEEQKAAMADLRQVVADEATEINTKIDALEEQITQLRAELETATGDNPALAALITDMEANVEDLRASAESVEALSGDEEEPTEPETPVEPAPEVPVEPAPIEETDEIV